MDIKKLIHCIRKDVLILLAAGGIVLYQTAPDIVACIRPAISFQDMLDGEEVKPGSRIAGNVVYSFDSFATESTYTRYSDGSRSGSRKSGKYYLLPMADGFIGLKCRQVDVAAMDQLTDETYEILMSSDSGAKATTEIYTQGIVREMDKEIAGLYQRYWEDNGFTQEDIEALGTPLLIEFLSFNAVRIGFAIGVLMVLIAVFIVFVRYRKAYEGSGLRRAEDLP